MGTYIIRHYSAPQKITYIQNFDRNMCLNLRGFIINVSHIRYKMSNYQTIVENYTMLRQANLELFNPASMILKSIEIC